MPNKDKRANAKRLIVILLALIIFVSLNIIVELHSKFWRQNNIAYYNRDSQNLPFTNFSGISIDAKIAIINGKSKLKKMIGH
jgi:hypothetical protein